MKMSEYRIVVILSLWFVSAPNSDGTSNTSSFSNVGPIFMRIPKIRIIEITDKPNVKHPVVHLFLVNGKNLYYNTYWSLSNSGRHSVRLPEIVLPPLYQIYVMLLHTKYKKFCNSTSVHEYFAGNWSETLEINFGKTCFYNDVIIESRVGRPQLLNCLGPGIKLPAIINFSWYNFDYIFKDSLHTSSLEKSSLGLYVEEFDNDSRFVCYGNFVVPNSTLDTVLFRNILIKVNSYNRDKKKVKKFIDNQEFNLCKGDKLYYASESVQQLYEIELNDTTSNLLTYPTQSSDNMLIICIYCVEENHSFYRYTKIIPTNKTATKQYHLRVGQTLNYHDVSKIQNKITTITSVDSTIPTETSLISQRAESNHNIWIIIGGISVLILITIVPFYLVCRLCHKKDSNHQNENLRAEYEMPTSLPPDLSNLQIPEALTILEGPCYDYAYISRECEGHIKDHVYDYAYGHISFN